MSNVHEETLARKINEQLTIIQEYAITVRQSGRAQEQCIEPTVTIDGSELCRISGRQRLKTAFLRALEEALMDEGLDVFVDSSRTFTITKPADDVETEFESFRDLKNFVSKLEPVA